MHALQQKIKNLKVALKQNSQKIRENNAWLRQSCQSPTTIYLGLGGSFFIGYFFTKKKSLIRLLDTILLGARFIKFF
jgi:hypothetical protein